MTGLSQACFSEAGTGVESIALSELLPLRKGMRGSQWIVLGSHPLGTQWRDHHTDQSTGNAIGKDMESNPTSICQQSHIKMDKQ